MVAAVELQPDGVSLGRGCWVPVSIRHLKRVLLFPAAFHVREAAFAQPVGVCGLAEATEANWEGLNSDLLWFKYVILWLCPFEPRV